MTEADSRAWFAVRCVFQMGWASQQEGRPLFEERITLWHAHSFEDALDRAEAEAREHASTIEEAPDTYLELAQAYRLDDEPGDGAEIFSLLRESDLEPEDYISTFFVTGSERSSDL